MSTPEFSSVLTADFRVLGDTLEELHAEAVRYLSLLVRDSPAVARVDFEMGKAKVNDMLLAGDAVISITWEVEVLANIYYDEDKLHVLPDEAQA
jgi:hypothetical protein